MNFTVDYVNERITFYQLAELKRLSEDESKRLKSIQSKGSNDKKRGVTSDEMLSFFK